MLWLYSMILSKKIIQVSLKLCKIHFNIKSLTLLAYPLTTVHSQRIMIPKEHTRCSGQCKTQRSATQSKQKLLCINSSTVSKQRRKNNYTNLQANPYLILIKQSHKLFTLHFYNKILLFLVMLKGWRHHIWMSIYLVYLITTSLPYFMQVFII